MFAGFEDVKDDQARKRWFASAGTSLVIYGVVGVGLLILAGHTVQSATEEAPIDVTFRASAEPEPEMEKAPPPPPAPVAAKPKRPGKLAPPKVEIIPEGRPDETTPTGGNGGGGEPEEFGDGELGSGAIVATVAVVAPPPPPPPPAVERTPDPIDELDTSFTPPRPLAGNRPPIYPEGARHKGQEAEVILKVRISAGGEVVAVELISGDEPFAAAAIAAVKTWRYRPALQDGRPVTYAIKWKIPFRIEH